MEGRILVEDEASAKHAHGRVSVTRGGDLIRLAVTAPGKWAFAELSPANWRQVIRQVQGLLTVPTDRGPGEFDQIQPDPVAGLDAMAAIAKRCEAAGTLRRDEPWDERGPMEQTYHEWANGGGPNECSHGIAAGLHCTPCGGISGKPAPESHLFARPGGEPWDDDTGDPVG